MILTYNIVEDEEYCIYYIYINHSSFVDTEPIQIQSSMKKSKN